MQQYGDVFEKNFEMWTDCHFADSCLLVRAICHLIEVCQMHISFIMPVAYNLCTHGNYLRLLGSGMEFMPKQL
jgi:hypothetical protein